MRQLRMKPLSKRAMQKPIPIGEFRYKRSQRQGRPDDGISGSEGVPPQDDYRNHPIYERIEDTLHKIRETIGQSDDVEIKEFVLRATRGNGPRLNPGKPASWN